MASPPAPRTRRAGPSLALRALLALALTVAFYVLAVGMAATLLFIAFRGGAPWIPAAVPTRFYDDYRARVLAAIVALVVLWSLLPRRQRFRSPGPELEPAAQPRLFAALESVARGVGQPMPRSVHLVADANAFVAEVGGFMGLGRRRLMGLGLPLLNTHSAGEIRAIVAHEFGHFHGGDTRLAPLVHGTRTTILRTLGNLRAASQKGKNLLLMAALLAAEVPFRAYAHVFLRVSHAVSRSQERAADALAARTAGAAQLASALRRLPALGSAWEGFLDSEVVPVIGAGLRPPLGTGFMQFISAGPVAEAMEKQAAVEREQKAADPLDTHPPLRERLEALEELVASGEGGPTPSAGDGAPAVGLLDDLDRLESALLVHAMENRGIARMPTVPWDQVPLRVAVPAWREVVRTHEARMGGMTPESLPRTPRALAEAGARLSTAVTIVPDHAQALGAHVLGAALALALLRRGFAVESAPGLPFILRRGDVAIEPFLAVTQVSEGTVPAEAWTARCMALGIADVDLSTVAAVPGPTGPA